MKDFKSYQRSNQNQEKAEQNQPADSSAALPSESEAAFLARKALAAYEGKSENAVLLEILRQAEAGKRAGTLTNADIDAFYAQFSPMLSEAQRKKLKPIVERLKKM